MERATPRTDVFVAALPQIIIVPETEANKIGDSVLNLIKHARDLERSNQILREALQSIIDGDVSADGTCFATWSGSQCVEIARDAIAAAGD